MSAPEIAELLPAEHARASFTGWLLRIVMPAAMVLTMITASIGISTWAYLAQRAEALARAEDFIASLEQRIRIQVNGYLAPVASLTALARDLLGTRALAPDQEASTRAFAMGLLEDNEQVAIASFADPGGDFVMYVRTPDGAVDTKRIERGASGVRTTWVHRDAAGRVIATEVVGDDGYDPRVRPWYVGATDPHEPYWTDVYVFFTSRQPGVTVSLPVLGPDGAVAAVYGMDITLDSLSRFLSRLQVGRSGKAMIINEQGRLVAFPDAARMLREEDGRLRTATLQELADPVLVRAYNRFRVEGPGRRVIEVGGARYLNTVTSLESVVGRPWSVLIVAPEEDFILGVKHNYHTQLVLNLLVLTIAAVLAALVVNQGLRADRIQRRATRRERERELERQGLAFSELMANAGLHDPADQEALRLATRTIAEALGVARVSLWRWSADRSALVCEDCYDRRSAGHTEGAELHASALAGLAGVLDEPLAVVDVSADARFRDLDHSYFELLGIQCVLSAPVRVDDAVRAVLWVEDGRRDAPWCQRALAFLAGITNVLALRERSAGAHAPLVHPPPEAPGRTRGAVQGEALDGHFHGSLHGVSLGEERVRRLWEAGAAEGGEQGADVYEHASVMVMLLDDAVVWARAGDEEGSPNNADRLLREVDTRARELGVAYVKVLGDRIVCAAGLDGEARAGAEALASLALEMEGWCTRTLAALDHRLAFRIGLDTGPVFGAALGGESWIYNLFGDAMAGAEAMAESAGPGTVQVSADAYALLHETHLFSHRGRYYVHGLGESSTYLLMGSA